ncbi:MAG: Uncharacterised protein [Flavobacteriaceae bacterium]|nr:MAG: Uncharacterised protein [Flavobacteriaceae bacterium]
MALTTNKKSLDSLYKAVSSQIKIDGQVLSSTYEVFKIETFKEINKLSRARVQILGGDYTKNTFDESESALFNAGNEIEIQFSYDQKPVVVFEGIILKHSISISEGYMRRKTKSKMVIECIDKAVLLKNSFTDTVYTEKTDDQIINNLINKVSGLTSSVESTTYEHPVLPKYNIDDWSFILERAKYNGLLVLNSNNKVTVKDPSVGEITPEVTITNGGGTLSFEAHLDSNNQYDKIQLEGRDSFSEEVFTKSGADPNEVVTNTKNNAKIISKKSSPSELNVNLPYDVDANELKVLADALTKVSRLQRVSGRTKFKGVLEIDLDTVVALSGFGNRFDGNVYVSAVSHQIEEGRIFTDIEFGLKEDFFTPKNIFDRNQLVNSITGLHLGKVLQIHNDPNNQYRIKVELPILNDLGNGIWAKLTQPYTGGGNGGTFFIPEVGTQVVVSFVGNDSRHPVVLGCLYNDSMKPYQSIEEENNFKAFVTKNDLKIQFDEGEKEIMISTPGGNEITLNDENSEITIKDSSNNQIKASSSGIDLKSSGKLNIDASDGISISSGGNITVDAKINNLSLKGNNISSNATSKFAVDAVSAMNLSSSGIAEIKGSIIKIN